MHLQALEDARIQAESEMGTFREAMSILAEQRAPAQEQLSPSNDNEPARERAGDWMQTYTGRKFWPMDPRSDEVFIEDIAHSLAMQCRYAGHCLRFYSVAEHSVLMARWFIGQGMYEEAWQALHHDDPEAYLVDVPRPVKPFLAGYKEAEHNVWLAVASRFGLPAEISKLVHEADHRILGDERAQNMTPTNDVWALANNPLGVTLQFWAPEEAEREFLACYWNLVETGRF